MYRTKRKLALRSETIRQLIHADLREVDAAEAIASAVWCQTQRQTCACSDGYSCGGTGHD